MGSSGTGRFSDYSNSASGVGKGGKNGSSDDDPCAQEIVTFLEEVERSQYFKIHKSLPPVGTSIVVNLRGRLAVEVVGELVGYLPSQYNFLASCMKSGDSYSGVITSVSDRPIFRIQVQINRV